MNGYIGISSKARKMKNIYIGVNNTARQVQKGYIGVNGVAKQFYQKMTVISAPSISSSYIYTGSVLTPTFTNYNSSTMTIGGTYSATNAGTYTATFTPKFGYCWSDESTSAKSVSWTIDKALGSVVLSATSGSVNKGSSITFTVNSYSGSLSVSSSDTSVATCSISGTTVTVKGLTSGSSAVITVTAAATSNYKTASSTYKVSVNYVWIRYQIAYNWGKYNCNATAAGYSQAAATYSYAPSASSYYRVATCLPIPTSGYVYRAGWVYTNTTPYVSFSDSTGLYTFNYGTYAANRLASTAYYSSSSSQSTVSTSGPCYMAFGTSNGFNSIYHITAESQFDVGYIKEVSTTNLSISYANSFQIINYYSYVSSYNYSKGSFISNVGSTNSSALPTNGRYASDGYWYVYTGTYNSGITVDTVSSSSSSAYADNGITGSYWCVKQ